MTTDVRLMTPEEMIAIHDAHVDAENRKDLHAALDTYHEDCFNQNVPLGSASRAGTRWSSTTPRSCDRSRTAS